MYKKLIVGITPCILAACTSMEYATEEGYQAELESYIGRPYREVVQIYGEADGISESASGNRLFIFEEEEVTSQSVDCDVDKEGNTTCTGGETAREWCKTFIEVSESDSVLGYSFKGNNCKRCSSPDVGVCF